MVPSIPCFQDWTKLYSADYAKLDCRAGSDLSFIAGKFLAGIVQSGQVSILIVWEWKAEKEVAKQELPQPTTCLAWSDSTTLTTAGRGNFKAIKFHCFFQAF